jgi:hypothetical protein
MGSVECVMTDEIIRFDEAREQKVRWTSAVMRGWAAAALLVGMAWTDTGRLDVRTIIQRSREASEVNWQAAPEYDYFERDTADSQGTRTYHVLMISGSPYRVLVEVNGEPLPPELKAREQHKLEDAYARRRAETTEQRAGRIANYERDRRRDRELLEQFTQAFEFRLLGEQTLGDHRVYVIQALPRPGYKPPNRNTEVLVGMNAKLYIDTRTFQWVRAEGAVVRPVWIDGLVARVQPGTRFQLDYAPVSEGIWQLSHFEMKSYYKVLFLLSIRAQDEESYFGYEKAPERPRNSR